MKSEKQEKTNEKRLEFLLITLEYIEKRKIAVENKSSILLAANAFILAGASSFGFLEVRSISSYLDLFQVFFTGITLLGLVFSILFCSFVLSGHTNDRVRGKLMDIKDEYNIFYFGKIAERKKDEYLAEIGKLTNRQIYNQIGGDVHNIARIARDRYKYFNRANRLFILATISFTCLAIIQWINPLSFLVR